MQLSSVCLRGLANHTTASNSHPWECVAIENSLTQHTFASFAAPLGINKPLCDPPAVFVRVWNFHGKQIVKQIYLTLFMYMHRSSLVYTYVHNIYIYIFHQSHICKQYAHMYLSLSLAVFIYTFIYFIFTYNLNVQIFYGRDPWNLPCEGCILGIARQKRSSNWLVGKRLRRHPRATSWADLACGQTA